jgi:hypothetical protein
MVSKMIIIVILLLAWFGAYTWIGKKNKIVKYSSIIAILGITVISIYYGFFFLNKQVLINTLFGTIMLSSILYDHLPAHWKDVNNI